ncbi:MAG: HAD-IIIC family phosphatase [Ruminococcus sp.]|nr:HAD-IIIC family phosphatase [Ruminococcus sp.]
MKELTFPFDGRQLMRRRRAIKNQLLSDGSTRIKKKIAVLAGSTADDVVKALELFLLDAGIEPEFRISEYNRFYESAVFGDPELEEFAPDIVYIHTTSRNLTLLPQSPSETQERTDELLMEQSEVFRQIWTGTAERFGCPVIQNNFELPLFRRTGNWDGWGAAGQSAFIQRMNVMVSDYARSHSGFYVNDISYLSAAVGLEKWHDPQVWYLYKYAMSLDVIPDLAYSLAGIIKSIYGRNKKVIALDLDNTLWGGVIGDDGQEGIDLGQETAAGQSFCELQSFLKGYRDMGVLLSVCSKNEHENALLGLDHPESILRPDDFVSIKANWDPKDQNLSRTAEELGLLTGSFVFVDDNPAECAIVEAQLPDVTAVRAESVRDTMYTLSRGGWFEVTSLTEDDLRRSEQYAANAKRTAQQKQFADYGEYLLSLDMEAEIGEFLPVQLSRITQLTNKSNQFNVTTRRYTLQEMEAVSTDSSRIAICGRLHDKFGDNGIVSVVIGRCEGDTLHIELWLMSCRVLKRDMELAMLDELVRRCRERGIGRIIGYYYKTPKNAMVSELFGSFGFTRESLSENGDSVWTLDTEGYENRNKVIRIKENSNG